MSFKLEIKNFQSIEYADLDISELTVVTGTNSAGKSALVRAFYGVFVNSPSKNLVRKNCEDLEVKVSFEDGNYVLWKKGKNHNDYVINGDSKENVNRGAPEDISEIGVYPIEVTSSQKKQFWPQVHQQHEPVTFVLSEQGSTIAEVVVSDVDKVSRLNQALSLSEKERREARSEEKIRKKDLEGIKKKIDRISPVREISEDVQEALIRLEKIKNLIKTYGSLCHKKEKLSSVRASLSTLKGLPNDFPKMDRLVDLQKDLLKKVRIFKQLKQTREQKTALKDIEYWKIPEVSFNHQSKLFKMVSFNEKINLLNTKIKEANTIKVALEKMIQENESKIKEFLGEMESCPTCGTLTSRENL